MKTKHLSQLVFAMVFTICLASGPAMSAGVINPDSDEILRSMSSYLGGASAFSVNADIVFEVVSRNGQKLQLSSFATAVLKRPSEFHIQRKGIIANAEFIFDGNTLTLYGKNLNVYAQIEVPGTIDDAIRAYELETGIPAPGADLLFADPYASISSGVESSAYLGIAYVNGAECHHLAFREAKVDWQLWVRSGDSPLPIKFVITSKWHTAAPQYEIRFWDWGINPQINDKRFTFSAPEGAKRLETIPADEMDEFTSKEEGK